MKVLGLLIMVFWSLNVSATDIEDMERELVAEISCNSESSLRVHMKNMGQLIKKIELYSELVLKNENKKDQDMEFYSNMLSFRFNLHAIFVKTPEKINGIPLSRRVKARRYFQKSIALLILKTVEVEEILFRTNLDAYAEKEQRVDMVKVLMSIKRIIDNAHKSFRD